MELMEGESLADRLARRGPISPTEVARIFTHVARALSRAHEAGIVQHEGRRGAVRGRGESRA